MGVGWAATKIGHKYCTELLRMNSWLAHYNAHARANERESERGWVGGVDHVDF